MIMVPGLKFFSKNQTLYCEDNEEKMINYNTLENETTLVNTIKNCERENRHI